MRSRCPQRKRSSSLPVPKIEVSLCNNAVDANEAAGKAREARHSTDDHSDIFRHFGE